VADIMPAGQRVKGKHPHRKTVAQMQFLTEQFSDEGCLVVDPCAGGWTTAEACAAMNRRFVGSDHDSECLEMAKERFEKFLSPQNNGKQVHHGHP
jgi:DNA modification methylase